MRLWLIRNSRRPAKSQSAPTWPSQIKRRSGTTSVSFAFTFAEGLPGIARVNATVLPTRGSPLIEGTDEFHSPGCRQTYSAPAASGGQPLGLTRRRPSSDPLERAAR